VTEAYERVAWEEEVATRYGLHRRQDRQFFDEVWAIGFNTSCDSFDEFDAFVETASKFYRLHMSDDAKTEEGAIGVKDSYPATRPGAEIELGDANSARIAALADYLQRTAALEPDILRFRERVLGSRHRTISRDEALRRLRRAEIPQGESPSGGVALVMLPEGDYGKRFRVPETSHWGELARLSVRVARAYPWDEAQATAFILCGDRYSADGRSVQYTPSTARVGTRTYRDKGPPTHPHSRTEITLSVASWIPVEVVNKLYLKEQRAINSGRKQGTPSLRNIEVFRFVLQHANSRTVNRGEYLEKLSLSKSWRELCQLWDKRWPTGHGWQYGDEGFRNFRRDFGLGQKAVIGTGQGLLGVTGEPRTRKEIMRGIKALKARYGPPR
jgi:hypothetical protein